MGVSDWLVAADWILDEVLAWVAAVVRLAIVGENAVRVGVLRHYIQI